MRDWFHTAFYWLNVLSWVRLAILLFSRRSVVGREQIPRRGPLILVSNHLNLADPPVLSVLTPRRIVWLAKRELFGTPVVGFLYHFIGCIPVRRHQTDLRALRRCERTLEKGQVLGMFPEGTRGQRGLGPGESGTALLALRTGAPILPVAIWGTEGVSLPAAFFRRTEVHIVYGEPFRLPPVERVRKDAVREATEEIMRRIAALLPPQYRGLYAGTSARAVAQGGS